jgi:GNAT superfamily N-acetyltransferase
MKMEVIEEKAEVIESMEQYVSVWKVLVGELSDADLTDKPGLSVSWADNAFPFWNAVFLTEQLEDASVLASRVKEASIYMRKRRQSGLLYICQDYLSGAAKESLPQILNEQKLEFVLSVTGMAGDIFPIKRRPHHGLRMERVTDEAKLQAYADLNCEAYGFPVEWGSSALKGSKLWKERAYTYLGYEGDHPVAAASAIENDGSLYLALVATRPDKRGNGYADAVVRHALQTAYEATGLRRTILHATDAGFPVYARVGYHQTAKILTYKPTA